LSEIIAEAPGVVLLVLKQDAAQGREASGMYPAGIPSEADQSAVYKYARPYMPEKEENGSGWTRTLDLTQLLNDLFCRILLA